MNIKKIRGPILKFLYYIAPMFTALVILISVVNYYHVSKVIITDKIIESSKRLPQDSMLFELRNIDLLGSVYTDEKQLIDGANGLLSGNMKFLGYPNMMVNMPFNSNDLGKGPPEFQLTIASLSVPKILLQAYQITGREEFYIASRNIILAFAEYDRKTWIPKGLFLNDHAIASRIPVLADFWRIYRKRLDYEKHTAKNILEFVARSGKLLSKRSCFTFSSNHGIMQNLSLLHLCLTFPTIPDIDYYKQIAINRLYDQMKFYVNNEGVVLEHSAGYHQWGIQLVSIAFRYLTLLDEAIPNELICKYGKMLDFYAYLRRPDGSLPMFGDTGSGSDGIGPFVTNTNRYNIGEILEHKKDWKPKLKCSLFPIAGYSIWWDGLDNWSDIQKMSQTICLWSYYPGHAHKHADEMSVILWAAGQTWWTNVGYRSYGTERLDAISWDGSNAPHIEREPFNSRRETNLIYYGCSDNMRFIELSRTLKQCHILGRQILFYKPNIWIIVDYAIGNGKDNIIKTWTTSHNIAINEGYTKNSYILKSEKSTSLTSFFLGSNDMSLELLKGSVSPSYSIVVKQPFEDSYSIVIWSLNSIESTRFINSPSILHWENPEIWEIAFNVPLTLATGIDNIHICRNGHSVYTKSDEGKIKSEKLLLISSPNVSMEKESIHNSYRIMSKEFPQTRIPQIKERLKSIYLLLLFTFIIQEIFFLIYKKKINKYYFKIRILSIICWISLGLFWLLIIC